MAERLFNNSRFIFIGELAQGKEIITTKKLSETSKWSRTRLNIGVRDDSNVQFLNMEYIHSDDVKTCKILNKDNEMIDVNLADTTKPETIEQASDLIKITIDLETDFNNKKEYTKLIFRKRNHEMKKADEKTDEDIAKINEYNDQIKELATNRIEFCHVKDVIAFLNEALPVLKDKKIKVSGNVKCNYYNGKNNLQYIPSLIEIVPNDTENQLSVYADIFYDKDGIDDDNKLKKFIVNGYLGERVKKADKLFPTSVVIDYTRVNEDDPEEKDLLDYMKNIFKITDKKQVHKIGAEIKVINGAEKIEFDESCLTPIQKMAIKLGKNKLEDFRPKGNLYGERTVELRVINGNFKDYQNGSIEVFSTKDLLDYIYQDDSDVKIDDVKKEEVKEESQDPPKSTQDMMKKLFG